MVAPRTGAGAHAGNLESVPVRTRSLVLWYPSATRFICSRRMIGGGAGCSGLGAVGGWGAMPEVTDRVGRAAGA
eukprot:CAMPEP_0169286270 /NCGR_PEP_ID=MMETSP1016-20121227/59195_1 /TAXON_ID=342587 /ORGANISM="Karlodinium micrum, Strain CCMP2283" /LENGTH=73 /DNA_ID=CAMNT_0009375939 /DNA_START=365 /DNA_END=582 /DNA_ORIENTATION=+